MNWRTTRTELTEILPLIFAAYPFLLLSAVYLFVLRARLHLGRWPTPYNPDPKRLNFTLHHEAIYLGVYAVPMFIVAAVILVIVGRFMGVNKRVWPTFVLLAISHLILFTLLHFDPGALIEWFMD